MKLKNKKILFEILNEIGDFNNISSYDYNKINNFNYSFKSELGTVNVEFEKIEDLTTDIKVNNDQFNINNINSIFNVRYDIEGNEFQKTKTTLKTLLPILKTIVNIINQFIAQKNLYGLIMIGISKLGILKDDHQKNLLYLMISKNNLPNGYRLSNVELDFNNTIFKGNIIFKQ